MMGFYLLIFFFELANLLKAYNNVVSLIYSIVLEFVVNFGWNNFMGCLMFLLSYRVLSIIVIISINMLYGYERHLLILVIIYRVLELYIMYSLVLV